VEYSQCRIAESAVEGDILRAVPGGLVSMMPDGSMGVMPLAVMMRSCSGELRGTRGLSRPGENRRHRDQQQNSKKAFHRAESFSVSGYSHFSGKIPVIK
jgi:hypothetical protein